MLSEMLISFLFVINVTVVNFLSPKNASESFLVISYIIKYYPNLLKHTKYSINKDDHFQHYFTLFLRKTVMEYYREFVKEQSLCYFTIIAMYRTSKCNHGEKAMCINCLVNKNKQIQNQTVQEKKIDVLACKHPPHMKCLRCLPQQQQKKCTHPEYQKCKNCWDLIRYEKFYHYLQRIKNECVHKKPCQKCVPPLSRKHYFIDRSCKLHLPYPQAMCDACMAPTISIQTQKYAHISRVVIKTTAIYKIIDCNMFGILLGRIHNDVIFVENVYFPEQQAGSFFISAQQVPNRSYIWEYLNLEEVGLLCRSSGITGLGLMISSLFQEKYIRFEDQHQISKFITIRLQLGEQKGEEPHFECFMVSDQLQSFHKNNLVYEKESHDNYFDLITAKKGSTSQIPTFLREGVETDKMYFKEALVWIETVSEQNFLKENSIIQYPFFTLDVQSFEHFKNYIQLELDPLQKYTNIQFLLHLQTFIGKQSTQWFINNYLPYDPDLFLKQRLKILERIQLQKLEALGIQSTL